MHITIKSHRVTAQIKRYEVEKRLEENLWLS